MQGNNTTARIRNPHLFFAEVSLDISRGEYQMALERLSPQREMFGDSYLFSLLYARALRGLGSTLNAMDHLRKCCAIAPANQVARRELQELYTALPEAAGPESEAPSMGQAGFDRVTAELEELSEALLHFEPSMTSETADPTPIVEQKMPFSDEEAIEVPTETLAQLFSMQGATKKAIKVYTQLIRLQPEKAAGYMRKIDTLLEKL
ncbi:MAG: hypothetical protein A3K90_06420 [Pelodictyon luteolum]|uniref:Tetratricopeptide repeat protein n=1 Tax=Pelodictyon luteolum TaxID=1100 RepID=A0A165LRR9_PELLU|nr:hypothetical protein [Pelodictyon luteolum]KZK74345.1 MAG: hypothetical protein A3K90_06420 [Pelodictyon luteolum]